GLGQLAVTAATMPTIQRTPVAQRALVHPEIPGHLRDRLTRLTNHPHRTSLEVHIELPPLLNHHRLLNGDVSTLRGETHGFFYGQMDQRSASWRVEPVDDLRAVFGGDLCGVLAGH